MLQDTIRQNQYDVAFRKWYIVLLWYLISLNWSIFYTNMTGCKIKKVLPGGTQMKHYELLLFTSQL